MSELKPGIHAADHVRGNIHAAIMLVEYGDYQCAYCKRAHSLVNRLLEEKGNEVLFVFRHFPLRKVHPLAFDAAVTAEAAGRQDRFWEMHDLIFENQKQMTPNYFVTLAENAGLDLEQFEVDSREEEIHEKIRKDFESGIRSGVNATPSFFINGSRLLTYDETYDSLLDAVNEEIWKFRQYLDEIKE